MGVKKALIYRRGGLGDTLLTFPVAEILKKEGYKVHFVGNTDYLKIAKEVGFIDKCFSEIPKGLNYDRIILFSKKNFLKTPKAKVVNPIPQKVWVLEHYFKSLNLKPNHSEVLPLKGLKEWSERIIFHPGSGSKKKNAPLELFKELYLKLRDLGEKPLFVLGEAERELKEELTDFETYEVKDILRFAKLLKGAKAFIGNDSGFSHLAGYLGVGTIALFGPTDPKVWKPIGKRVKILYKNLKCSPCFPKGCQSREYKACLKFKAEEVLEKLSCVFGV